MLLIIEKENYPIGFMCNVYPEIRELDLLLCFIVIENIWMIIHDRKKTN